MARFRLVLALTAGALVLALGARYALEERKSLWALDARSGRVTWMQDISDAPPTQALTTHNGALYWVNREKGPNHRVTLSALDASSGAQRWTRSLDGRVLHARNIDVYAAGDVLVVNSLPIRGPFAPVIDAFGAQDGAPRWSLPMGERRWIAPVAAGASRLFLLESNGAIRAVDAATGAETGTQIQTGAFGGNGETVFAYPGTMFGFDQGQYVLLPTAGGARITLPITRTSFNATPRLIFGLDPAYNVLAFDDTGVLRWKQSVPKSVAANGAMLNLVAAAETSSGSAVVLAPIDDSESYHLIAFDQQGAIRWQTRFARDSFDYPQRLFAVDDVILSRSNDTLRAFTSTNGELLWTRSFELLYSTSTFDASAGRFIDITDAPRWHQWMFYFGLQPGA
jgi:outer membrane protein assembly factor BamB